MFGPESTPSGRGSHMRRLQTKRDGAHNVVSHCIVYLHMLLYIPMMSASHKACYCVITVYLLPPLCHSVISSGRHLQMFQTHAENTGSLNPGLTFNRANLQTLQLDYPEKRSNIRMLSINYLQIKPHPFQCWNFNRTLFGFRLSLS